MPATRRQARRAEWWAARAHQPADTHWTAPTNPLSRRPRPHSPPRSNITPLSGSSSPIPPIENIQSFLGSSPPPQLPQPPPPQLPQPPFPTIPSSEDGVVPPSVPDGAGMIRLMNAPVAPSITPSDHIYQHVLNGTPMTNGTTHTPNGTTHTPIPDGEDIIVVYRHTVRNIYESNIGVDTRDFSISR